MTQKNKAEELVKKYENAIYEKPTYTGNGVEAMALAKECALIAVNEINEAIDFDWMEIQNLDRQHKYWDEVRQEIIIYEK